MSAFKKLNELLERKEELDKKIKKLKKLDLWKNRKEYEEKCRIVGEYFMEQYKNKMNELKQRLDPVLKSKRSRKLFGLDRRDKE